MTDSHFESGKVVLVEEFNHGAMDSLEDRLRERLEMGMAALDICEEYAIERGREIALDQIRTILTIVSSEKKPVYLLDQLIWLSGVASANNITLPSLAKKHGVSKQAFEQASKRTGERFHFPKTSAQRSDEARQHMSNAYHSHKP